MHRHGYLLNTETYRVEIKVNETTKQAIVNEEPVGVFSLLKQNEDGSATIAGVRYRVWSDNGYNEKFVTDSTGGFKVEGLKLRKILLSRRTDSCTLLVR